MIKRQTRIFIYGFVLAGVVLITGQGVVFFAKSELTSLVETCKRDAGENRFGDYMLCEPDDFRYPYPTSGIQAQIVAEDQGIKDMNGIFMGVSAAILLISSLPWGWYFLLQRIRELSNAIMGRKE